MENLLFMFLIILWIVWIVFMFAGVLEDDALKGSCWLVLFLWSLLFCMYWCYINTKPLCIERNWEQYCREYKKEDCKIIDWEKYCLSPNLVENVKK